MHGKCGVGEQGKDGERTCDCDSESHPVEQSGGTGDVQP